ncbi:hypothetical protein ACFQZJ_18085 [Maribacter chungangensis]|uniref:Uncharacterized protein n=1 Tax=Maribacter chungangensis TaxID=1069117 RepID=A0ABW3B7S2_9FLAO
MNNYLLVDFQLGRGICTNSSQDGSGPVQSFDRIALIGIKRKVQHKADVRCIRPRFRSNPKHALEKLFPLRARASTIAMPLFFHYGGSPAKSG